MPEPQVIELEGRPLPDICKELNARLRAEGLLDESLGVHWSAEDYHRPWPKRWCWIACYAVTGGSEGHHIHIDVITGQHKRKLEILGKTFRGMEHALKIANRCAVLLGA